MLDELSGQAQSRPDSLRDVRIWQLPAGILPTACAAARGRAMKSGMPWSLRGIDEETREAIHTAARRAGLTVN